MVGTGQPKAVAAADIWKESGVFPHNWNVRRLGDECEVITKGTTPTSIGRPFTESGINFIKIETLEENGRLVRSKVAFVDKETHELLKRSQLRANDILISIAGALGRVAVVTEDILPANTNQALAIVRLKAGSRIGHDYLFYVLNGPSIKRHIGAINVQGAQANLSLENVGNFMVPCPSLGEQKAIARGLADVDALIVSLDDLIAKKRDMKTAAMLQLLTGRRRLHGFSGGWESDALGDGVSLLSGHHVLAQHCNARGEGTPYLTGPADFPGGKIQQTKFTDRPTTLCAPGDILVTVKGSGSGSLVIADAVYCISRQLMAIRVREWDSRFIYYSLLQNASQFKAATTGLIPGLSRDDILEQILPLPPVPEQVAIAAVLTDMDTEITALEARRDKTQALKQGMMQQLLTGKIRLI